MFGAILKDQEQKSDELRDKIHAENKLKKEEAEKSCEREKAGKVISSIKKEAPDPLMQVRSFFVSVFSRLNVNERALVFTKHNAFERTGLMKVEDSDRHALIAAERKSRRRSRILSFF